MSPWHIYRWPSFEITHIHIHMPWYGLFQKYRLPLVKITIHWINKYFTIINECIFVHFAFHIYCLKLVCLQFLNILQLINQIKRIYDFVKKLWSDYMNTTIKVTWTGGHGGLSVLDRFESKSKFGINNIRSKQVQDCLNYDVSVLCQNGAINDHGDNKNHGSYWKVWR